jgi:protein-disulfide isomerase
MTLRRQASVAALLFAAVISACTAGRKLADTLPAAARSSHEALPGDAALLVRFSPEGWRDVQSFARMLGADLSRTVTGISELSAERADPLQLTGPMVLASVTQLLDADSAKSGFDPERPVFTALWSMDAQGLVEAASLGVPPEPKDRPRGLATTVLFPASNADAWAKHLEQWWAGRPMAAATQAKITTEGEWVRLVVFAPWPAVAERDQEPAAAAFAAFTARPRPEPLRLTPALVSFLADPADVLVHVPLERARAFALAQHALDVDVKTRNLPPSQAAQARLEAAAEALQAWQMLDPAVAEVEDWSVRMDAVPGQGIVLRGLSTLTAEGRRLAKLRPPPRTMPALRDQDMLAELSFASDGEAARKAALPLRGVQKEGPEGEEVDTKRELRSLAMLMTLLRSPNALLRTVFEGVEGLEGTGSLTALHLRVYPPLGTGDSAAIPRAVAQLSFEDEASADRNAEKIRAFASGPAASLLRVERPKTKKDGQPLVTMGVLAVPDELRAQPEAQIEVPPGVHLKITAAALDALGAQRSEKWEPLAALLRQGPFELRTVAEDTVNRFTLQLGAVPEAKPTKTPRFDPVAHAAEGRECRLALAEQAEAPLKALGDAEPAARSRQLDALYASVDRFQTRCAGASDTQARAAAARERLGRLREHLSTIKEEPPPPTRQDVLLHPPAGADRPQSPLLKAEFPKHAPVKGRPDAKVTVLIFSDFQCPFCARVEGTLDQLEKQYGNDLRFVWINQPLPFHQDAKPAAKAAMAAHEQGKFWEYKDLLFADIRNLSDDALVERARTLGLDLERFDRDRASGEIAERIE